jgi:hypothetical protein
MNLLQRKKQERKIAQIPNYSKKGRQERHKGLENDVTIIHPVKEPKMLQTLHINEYRHFHR